MGPTTDNRLEWLRSLQQSDWDRTVQELLPALHEVDRLPVRIWFSWWPIKLAEGLSRAPALDAVERDWCLKGNFTLQDQLLDSIKIFYAASCWPEVAKTTLQWAEEAEGEFQADLAGLLLDGAKQVAARVDSDVAFLLPLQAAALMALRQVGSEPLRQQGPAVSRRPAPARVLEKRQREPRSGLFSFLRNADRQHRVCFDEESGETFMAYQDQDLSMASAMDTRDYSARDPRCTEGPIPFECRSGACGTCWIAVLGGKERLAPISQYEKRRLRHFGYLSADEDIEAHPPIRLACQAHCQGSVTIVVPPWNGTLDGRE